MLFYADIFTELPGSNPVIFFKGINEMSLRCCDVPPELLAQIDQIAFDGEQLIRILFKLKTLILVLAAAAITA